MGSLLAILAVAVPVIPVSMCAGDYVHFLLVLPYYTTQIAPSSAESGQIHFHWPSAGFIPGYERNLVYDPWDELAHHVGELEPLAAEPAVKRSVRHFIGHFYLVEDFW